jgi:hypothetical protein
MSGISVDQDIDLHSNTEKYSDRSGPHFRGILRGLSFPGNGPVPNGEDDPSIIGNAMTAHEFFSWVLFQLSGCFTSLYILYFFSPRH